MPVDDDFAALLRRFRERLDPEAAGTPSLRVRRARGLRRDELAAAAGISEHYVTRLEQRRRHPSAGVVDALARALRLGPEEHGVLRTAAGYAAPEPVAGRVPRELTPAARRLLDRLTEVPVCVCDATWTVLAGNACWQAYGCGSGTPNMALRVFRDAPTAVFRTPEHLAAFRASLVAGLRAAAHRYRADERLRDLIAELHRTGDGFTRLWHDPALTEAAADRLRVPSPDGGRIDLDKDVLTLDGDLRVVVLTPVGGAQTGPG